MKFNRSFLLSALMLLLCQCHSTKWHEKQPKGQLVSASNELINIFNKYPEGVMRLRAETPGYNYKYDIAEKDALYGADSTIYHFKTVEITLHQTMPKATVMADFRFLDDQQQSIIVKDVDLLRLTPKLDSEGDLNYAELLLEEFNRFGLSFRKEHEEFQVQSRSSETLDAEFYRCSIVNNCLDGTKWEFALNSEDYSDFKDRINGHSNLNQNRLVAHSWFYLDEDLYYALMHIKNPGLNKDLLALAYNELSDKAENTVVNFDALRNSIKYVDNSKVIEIGHKTNRPIEPLDVEEYYKREFGLLLNNKNYTYRTILEQPVNLTQFLGRGYYTSATPKICDFNWMQYADDIKIDVIDLSISESYVQITITGEWVPYEVTIGNIDLALIDEQNLFGLLFGINTYPKSRRYNPSQNTIAYDAELLPEEIKPYVLLTDKKTGKWVNNQYKGIEKIYLTYDSGEHDVLNAYILSYERITPVWMGKVKLSKRLREKVRVRRNIYNY